MTDRSRQVDAIINAFEVKSPAFDINWSGFERLLAAGVTSPAIVHPELPKLAQVAFDRRNRHFCFGDEADEGVPLEQALIFAARDELGAVVDLAAISLDFSRIGAHGGYAGVLGRENVYAPRIEDARMPVFTKPLAWLRGGRKGLLVFDARPISTRTALALARDLVGLLVDEEDLDVVERILAPPPGRIRVNLQPSEAA